METQAQKRWEQEKLDFACSLDREDKWYSDWVRNFNYIIKLLGEIKQREKQIDKVVNDPDMDDATALQILTKVIAEMQKANE